MTLVPSFPNRLRRMVGILFNPINDNRGALQRWETPPRMETDTSECMERILGALYDLKPEAMQILFAKAVLTMATCERGEFVGIGDADPRDFRELALGLVVLEEGRVGGNPAFRIPHADLREELRRVSVEVFIARARPRRQ